MAKTAPGILILMGVSGSGKTTVGQRLARDLGWPFYEGDNFHPADNVAKMAQGVPLADADRYPWLQAIRALIVNLCETNQRAVITCSALKQAYRDLLRVDEAKIRFVYLQVDPQTLQKRLHQRQAHFMPASLIDSQIAALEEPADALAINAHQPVEQVIAQIRASLLL